MPTFIDGPAAGEALTLTRAPALLRIAQNGPVFRPLEAYDAEPDYTELLYVYQIDGRPSENPALAATATYRFIDPQPRESRIFLTGSWRAYARAFLAGDA